MLPARLLDRLAPGAHVHEAACGSRFDDLESLARARPDLRLSASDVHPHLLEGAAGSIETFPLDLFDPDPASLGDVDLIYAVRCPEELQGPLLDLADGLGAHAAIHALKDERATLPGHPPGQLMQGEDGRSWRFWPAQA
ncbi:MAG: UPF0146 family protein [Candidatus Thermoplasmatota archaeon]|nr:UPF0146 family protein [Candidatus Thermoplasmatota archaeon]